MSIYRIIGVSRKKLYFVNMQFYKHLYFDLFALGNTKCVEWNGNVFNECLEEFPFKE